MKNKKGFTLIELLAVIALIALISLIAIPNIVGLSTGIRKDAMLDDAKKLIARAKYMVSKNYDIRTSPPYEFSYLDLNANNDIKEDPDGGEYITGSVTYRIEDGVAKYCVYLEGSIRKVCKKPDGCERASCCNLCIDEDILFSRANVVDKE